MNDPNTRVVKYEYHVWNKIFVRSNLVIVKFTPYQYSIITKMWRFVDGLSEGMEARKKGKKQKLFQDTKRSISFPFELAWICDTFLL